MFCCIFMASMTVLHMITSLQLLFSGRNASWLHCFAAVFTRDCVVRLLRKLSIYPLWGLHPVFKEIAFFNESLHKHGLWEDVTASHTQCVLAVACLVNSNRCGILWLPGFVENTARGWLIVSITTPLYCSALTRPLITTSSTTTSFDFKHPVCVHVFLHV